MKTEPWKLIVPLAVLLLLQPWAADAQQVRGFPGMPVDSRLLRVQNQAERIFERTQYERAFFIYRNELVPIGDKYAQYMVGFMYLTGKGIAEDHVVASAWYRLAAERDIRELSEARDQLMAILDDSERARSDGLFLELRRQYGDLALLMRELRNDQAKLGSTTGSRIGTTGSPTVILMPDGRTQSASVFYQQIERRFSTRLDYICDYLDIQITDRNPATVDLNLIERHVDEFLATVD